MSKFDKVKKYYDAGLWDLSRVQNAVDKEWITSAEYKQITGKDYLAEV